MAVAEERGIPYRIVQYQKQAERPDRAELEALVAKLEGPVEDLVRKDSKFKALGLAPADYVGNRKAVVDVLEQHIALLQRPVLVLGNRAIVGRPRDAVNEFLS